MKNSKTNKPAKPLMNSEQMRMGTDKLFEFIKNQNFASIEEANEFLKEHVNGKRIEDVIPKKPGPKSNIEKSDDLVYEALESSPTKAKKLVNEALELNPENVRAITILGNTASSADQAMPFFLKAMDIAKRQLGGDDFFEEHKGHFWAMVETRPYMTAKMSYANCLGHKNKTAEAIEQYQEMLELNSSDNQGVRYSLSPLLLLSKQYDTFLKLHKEFDEASTSWLFDYALYLFITTGITPASKKALKEANKSNKHVLAILTGKEKSDGKEQDYYSPGDPNEAVMYIAASAKLWVSLKNFRGWIESVIMN